MEFATPGEGLDTLKLWIEPQDARVLRRVFLRVPGGCDAVPALETSRTRMFALPNNVFVEKGIVKLGKDRGTVTSSFLTVLSSGKRNLLAGVGDMCEDFSFLSVDGKTLEAGFEPERALRKETSYCLVVATGSDPLDLLDTYGRYLSRFSRTRVESVAGRNSWDYYGGSVTMADLRKCRGRGSRGQVAVASRLRRARKTTGVGGMLPGCSQALLDRWNPRVPFGVLLSQVVQEPLRPLSR